MMTTMRLFARSRGGVARLGIMGAAAALPVLLAPAELSGVPVRDAAASILLNTVLLTGTVVVFPLGAPWRELDEALPNRPLRELRLTWALLVSSMVVLPGLAAVVARGDADWLLPFYGRNALLGIGIGTLSVCLLPRTAAWLPATGYGMICWIWGTEDLLGTARVWALPNHEMASWLSLLVAGGVWVGGAALYTYRDGQQVP